MYLVGANVRTNKPFSNQYINIALVFAPAAAAHQTHRMTGHTYTHPSLLRGESRGVDEAQTCLYVWYAFPACLVVVPETPHLSGHTEKHSE